MSKGKNIKLSERLLREGVYPDEKTIVSRVMAGKVLVNDRVVVSAAQPVRQDDRIRVRDYYQRYVNRGGLKLAGALRDFGVSVEGKAALDAGASTGGFTDCLLQHGCRKVYAVDAGFGQLSGKLRQDARVVNLERTNLGDDCLRQLADKPEIITLDLSYLSLKNAVPLCSAIMEGRGEVIALVKPLFETESAELRRTGSITAECEYIDIMVKLAEYFAGMGFATNGVTSSAIKGNSGTTEFFMRIGMDGSGGMNPAQLAHAIDEAVARSRTAVSPEKMSNDYLS